MAWHAQDVRVMDATGLFEAAFFVAESRRELELVASPPDETRSQQSSLLEALCGAGDDAAADAAALAAASATDDDEGADHSDHAPMSSVSEAEEKSTDDSAAPSLAP